jgi:hypothetical protein
VTTEQWAIIVINLVALVAIPLYAWKIYKRTMPPEEPRHFNHGDDL